MPDLRTRPRPHRPAFSLIELLVAISIIALLIAILLPALRSAREVARQAYCLTNQRSNGLALAMYANDFQETLPAGWDMDIERNISVQQATFRERLNPYLTAQFISSANAANDVTTRIRDHWRCPSMPENPSIIDFGYYGANPTLMPVVDTQNSINSLFYDGRYPQNTYITLNTITKPSDTVAFFEFKRRNGKPFSNARFTTAVAGLAPGIPYKIQFPHARSEPMNATAGTGNATEYDVPANGSAGTGYMDGHAKLTKIEDYPTISPFFSAGPNANGYLTWVTDQ